MKKYLLPAILVFVVLIRFFFLDTFPPGLSNDEIEYAVSAKSYALYGRDTSGFGLPQSILKTQTDGEISPVAPLLISIPLNILPLNQTTVRLISIFVNLLTAIAVYLLITTLFHKKNIGLIGSILFLINPWSIYFSTQIYEPPFALLFYLLGISTLIRYKNWKLLIPFSLFILAFFSYHGGKIVFLPIIGVTLIYKAYVEKIKLFKSWTILNFSLASVVFLILYIFISQRMPGSTLLTRSNELIFEDTNISSIVNDERRQSIENPITNILINKPMVITKIFFRQYLQAFSPDILFMRGDTRALYRFDEHGLFYLFDFPIILLGLAGVYTKEKKAFWLLAAFTLIAPIGTAISRIEISVINRSFLLLPFLLIFSAYGFVELINIFKAKTLKKWFTVVVSLTILLFVFNFYHFFLFRLPVTGQEKYWLSERILKKYLTYNISQSHVEFITTKPRSAYLRAIFLSNNYVQKDSLARPIPPNQPIVGYQLDNVNYTSVCPKTLDPNIIYAINTSSGCKYPDKPDFVITDQKDAGVLINLYNTSICKGVSGEQWRRFNVIPQYLIEKLDYTSFCSEWIFKFQ